MKENTNTQLNYAYLKCILNINQKVDKGKVVLLLIKELHTTMNATMNVFKQLNLRKMDNTEHVQREGESQLSGTDHGI